MDKDLEGFNGYAWIDDYGILWATIHDGTSEELRKYSDIDNTWTSISLDGKLINTSISNGNYDVIASPDGLGIFYTDKNKTEWVIKDIQIKKILRKGLNNFILITNEGIKEIDLN